MDMRVLTIDTKTSRPQRKRDSNDLPTPSRFVDGSRTLKGSFEVLNRLYNFRCSPDLVNNIFRIIKPDGY
jgi:hypothetical protein